ncbi:MAG TPA: S41 family peptidase [Gemmatimonadaceae bacterium]
MKPHRLFSLTIFFLALLAEGAGAQSPLSGKWSGEMITDAFRGTMTLTVPGGASEDSVQLAVTVGDRTSAGSGKILLMAGDSIRFMSTVGGAETSYRGALHGDSIIGTLEARRDGELLGRGRWVLVRAAVRSPAMIPATPSPVAIFDEAWKLVDTRYGNFPAKGIDWDLIRRIYRDAAAAAKDDRELAGIISTMLGHLNDNHITLRAKDTLYRPNGEIDRSSFVPDSVVARRFASAQGTSGGGDWTYAWMGDSIAYLRIDGFHNARNTRAQIDSVLKTFRPARGMVIDLRKHFGGDDPAANEVIDRFATSRGLYLVRRAKGGDAHDLFLEPSSFYYEPRGSWQFTKPVMVLTSSRTVSAGENFLLGMRELPQVTVIGDVTSGAFADVGHFKLSNGWELNFPFNRMVDKNGFSWEGVGLAPDIKLVAKLSDISAGRDVLLDFAVRAIKAASARH